MFATKGKLPTYRSAVALVVLRAGGNVGDEAVAIVIDHGEARRRIFAQRQVGDGGDAIGVVVAHFPGDQKLLLLSRLLGDHADGARHRVLAEQCALRAARHFHAFEVENLDVLCRRLPHVHAVHVDAGTGVETDIARVCTHAADAHRGRAVVAAGNAHVGDELSQLTHLAHTGFLQRFAAHDGNGNGYIGKALGALLRGNHHFLQHTDTLCGGVD